MKRIRQILHYSFRSATEETVRVTLPYIAVNEVAKTALYSVCNIKSWRKLHSICGIEFIRPSHFVHLSPFLTATVRPTATKLAHNNRLLVYITNWHIMFDLHMTLTYIFRLNDLRSLHSFDYMLRVGASVSHGHYFYVFFFEYWKSSADPDEMACYEPAHLDLHCLQTLVSTEACGVERVSFLFHLRQNMEMQICILSDMSLSGSLPVVCNHVLYSYHMYLFNKYFFKYF